MEDNRHAQGHAGDVVPLRGEASTEGVSPDAWAREAAAPRPVLFAIGDIHGNYDALQSILQTLQSRHQIFTDSGMESLADHVTLVFTGDYVDRGPDAIKALDYLARMKSSSEGRLVMLMGNHEAMALAALGAIRTMAGIDLDQSSRVLAAWRHHAGNGGKALYIEIFRMLSRQESPDDVAIAKAFLEEFGRGGRAGNLLRSLDILHFHEISGKTFLFSHGDVPRDSRTSENLRNRRTLERLRQKFKAHVAGESDTRDWVTKYDTDLPGRELLWGRNYTGVDGSESDFAGMNSREEAVRAREICDACGVDYIVAGHTPTPDGQIRAYGDRIFHVDVGMIRGGEPTALMVSDAGIASVTQHGDRMLVSF